MVLARPTVQTIANTNETAILGVNTSTALPDNMTVIGEAPILYGGEKGLLCSTIFTINAAAPKDVPKEEYQPVKRIVIQLFDVTTHTLLLREGILSNSLTTPNYAFARPDRPYR